MGGKGKSSNTTVQLPQQTQGPDVGAMMEPMLAYLAQSQAITKSMIEQQQAMQLASTPPEPTSVDVIDYEAENKAIKEKMSKAITAEDIKRKGVLGTILTSLSDDDDPDAITSLLGGSAK